MVPAQAEPRVRKSGGVLLPPARPPAPAAPPCLPAAACTACPAPRARQVALPELDGGIEPIVFAGRDSNTGKSHSLPDRIDSLCK